MRKPVELYGSTDTRYYDPAYAVLRDPSGDREFYASLAERWAGRCRAAASGPCRSLRL